MAFQGFYCKIGLLTLSYWQSMAIFFNLDPVAFTILGVGIRWYGLCFATGVWLVCTCLEYDRSFQSLFSSKKQFEHFIFALLIGVLLGAKAGYLLFYTPSYAFWSTLFSPAGLSFHGALLGLILSLLGFSYQVKIPFIKLTDKIAEYVPLGLFLGRIGNFLNSELWGRATGSSWGFIFQRTDPLLLTRHPSQLYEACAEGLLLWTMLQLIRIRYPYDGMMSSSFLVLYGLLRAIIEHWREPDQHLGLFFFSLTMGQILCLVMILLGFALMRVYRVIDCKNQTVVD
jgi:phosphatidylglycerol:prolipoprotein diacylglycerol transferase